MYDFRAQGFAKISVFAYGVMEGGGVLNSFLYLSFSQQSKKVCNILFPNALTFYLLNMQN